MCGVQLKRSGSKVETVHKANQGGILSRALELTDLRSKFADTFGTANRGVDIPPWMFLLSALW